MRRAERVVLMPILARGAHVHPRDGGCFAEVAAALTTHCWTDHPACIPPVLAQLARGVNDRTSAEARTALAPLIPWAINGPRPTTDLTADAAVISLLTGQIPAEVLRAPVPEPLLRRLDRRPRPRHVLDRAGWRRAARRLVRAQLRAVTATLDGPDRDARLRALLVGAIDATRAAVGLGPLPEPGAPPEAGEQLVPVIADLASVDEVLELRVDPVLEDWPDWLRDPWSRRLSEMEARTAPDGEERPDGPAAVAAVAGVGHGGG
ncbi:hypothetical protein [Geodermatophilus ruber]|uniref:Uncharacterized protein n=1 Tax=Geodermatophilus ruber TaxID=504800 RepID=A0A1I4FWZ0_9ACTN|nr:hypothetical protein [Geodermatophilus ruber]SFL22344.1 hypothetical protein SAMN04488085_10839 [Geodermatophilus ruber]